MSPDAAVKGRTRMWERPPRRDRPVNERKLLRRAGRSHIQLQPFNTSSTQLIAAIMFGNPIVVTDNKTA
jgi:hypothetical protein